MSSDSESISDSDIEISEKTLLQDGDVSKCQDELIFDPVTGRSPTFNLSPSLILLLHDEEV